MPTYAVRIGDIDLIADEPITAEQRAEIVRKIKAEGYGGLIELLRYDVVRFRPATAEPPLK